MRNRIASILFIFVLSLLPSVASAQDEPVSPLPEGASFVFLPAVEAGAVKAAPPDPLIGSVVYVGPVDKNGNGPGTYRAIQHGNLVAVENGQQFNESPGGAVFYPGTEARYRLVVLCQGVPKELCPLSLPTEAGAASVNSTNEVSFQQIGEDLYPGGIPRDFLERFGKWIQNHNFQSPMWTAPAALSFYQAGNCGLPWSGSMIQGIGHAEEFVHFKPLVGAYCYDAMANRWSAGILVQWQARDEMYDIHTGVPYPTPQNALFLAGMNARQAIFMRLVDWQAVKEEVWTEPSKLPVWEQVQQTNPFEAPSWSIPDWGTIRVETPSWIYAGAAAFGAGAAWTVERLSPATAPLSYVVVPKKVLGDLCPMFEIQGDSNPAISMCDAVRIGTPQ